MLFKNVMSTVRPLISPIRKMRLDGMNVDVELDRAARRILPERSQTTEMPIDNLQELLAKSRPAEEPRPALEQTRACKPSALSPVRPSPTPGSGLLWAPIAPQVFDPRLEQTRIERAPVVAGTPLAPTPVSFEPPLLELDDPAKPLRVSTPPPRSRPITPVAQPTISDARPRPIIERDRRPQRIEWKKHLRHLAPAIALLAFCSLGFSVVDLALSVTGVIEPPSGVAWWTRTGVSFFAGAVACAWSLVRPQP